MRKCLTLSILLFLLTTISCKTLPKKQIVLPPKPQREKIPEVTSLKDIADVINYYEHLVEEWEEWGNSVTLIVEDAK